MRELKLTETQTPIDCCAPLGASTLSDREAEATASLFAALADPARIRIVNLVATSDEPVCACELVEPLGLSQPTVSHHLKKLPAAGLLEREQRETPLSVGERDALVIAVLAELFGPDGFDDQAPPDSWLRLAPD